MTLIMILYDTNDTSNAGEVCVLNSITITIITMIIMMGIRVMQSFVCNMMITVLAVISCDYCWVSVGGWGKERHGEKKKCGKEGWGGGLWEGI